MSFRGQPKFGGNERKLLAPGQGHWIRRKYRPLWLNAAVEFTHLFSFNNDLLCAHYGVRPSSGAGDTAVNQTHKSPALKSGDWEWPVTSEHLGTEQIPRAAELSKHTDLVNGGDSGGDTKPSSQWITVLPPPWPYLPRPTSVLPSQHKRWGDHSSPKGRDTVRGTGSSWKMKMHWCQCSSPTWVGKGTVKHLHQNLLRTSLVAQWLRILLPTQGTRVRALVREDPTCLRATKSVHHNYWACTLEPTSHNYWAHVPQLLKPTRLEPVLRNKRSHHNEKPAHHNRVAPARCT